MIDAKKMQSIAQRVAAVFPNLAAPEFHSSSTFGNGRSAVKFVFKNGLKLIIAPDTNAPVFSFQTWYQVGSSDEPANRSGLPHFFEHLMFLGTKENPKFSRILQQVGGQDNAMTGYDYTCYFQSLPVGQLDLVAKLEADRMTGLVLTPEQVQNELDVVINERLWSVDNDPNGQLDEALYSALFPNHPYGAPVIGFLQDIKNLIYADLMEFYRARYSPENATIVVAGHVDVEEVLTTILKWFGPISGRPVASRQASGDEHNSGGYTRQELLLPVSSPRLLIAWRTVPFSHPDADVLDLAMEILLGNEASRVHKSLVEDLQIASDVDATSESMRLGGSFVASITLNEGSNSACIEKALDVVFGHVNDLALKGPKERELLRAKNLSESDHYSSLGTAHDRGIVLGSYELLGGDYRTLSGYVSRIQGIKADEVSACVKRWLNRDNAVVIIARPFQAAAIRDEVLEKSGAL